MQKTFFDVLKEINIIAEEDDGPKSTDISLTDQVLSQMIKLMGAKKKPQGPPEIRAAADYLRDNNEFKLFQFLQRCVFYEVPRGPKKIHWYNTAGVTPIGNRSVIFLYDKEFIEELVDYYIFTRQGQSDQWDKRKVTKEEFGRVRMSKPQNTKYGIYQGRLLFLIAHEALHIFRHHTDRQQRAGLDGKLYNIAADSVINWQLANDIKQIGGEELEFIKNGIMLEPEKFEEWGRKKHGNFDFRKNLNADVTYQYYLDNKQPEPKKREKQIQVGSIVKIKSGKNKDKYIRVTSIDERDGSIEGVEVDIKEEKRKAKQGAAYVDKNVLG